MDKHFRSLEEKIPKQGFIKITDPRVTTLSGEQRIFLIRKGNAFYNEGKFDQAKKIFLTTGYSDGIIRIADKCLENNEPFEALRLYKIAPAVDKADELIKKMAGVLRNWLK